MGLSFGNYALCDDEFSCFPPLLDDLVGQMGYQDKFAICANGVRIYLINIKYMYNILDQSGLGPSVLCSRKGFKDVDSLDKEGDSGCKARNSQSAIPTACQALPHALPCALALTLGCAFCVGSRMP